MSPEHYAPLLVLLVMLPVILLRNRRRRTLRPQYLWVMPAIIVVMIGFGIWGMSQAPGVDHRPFAGLDWLILAVGLALGCAAGWQRGRMMTVEKDADGTLKAQASPLGLILIVVLLAGRSALRPWLEAHAGGWHVSAMAIQDAFMLFAIGVVVAQRVELFIRARRILAGQPDAHVEVAA